jgi:hypothetical protein
MTFGERQVYFTTLLTNALAGGQALVATAYLPDLHHFRGSFGGGGVFPLYRDAVASSANVTKGVLELLDGAFGSPVSAEDFAGYVYGVLAGSRIHTAILERIRNSGSARPRHKIRRPLLGGSRPWPQTYMAAHLWRALSF